MYNFDKSIFDGVISTHAPRTGSDIAGSYNWLGQQISTHAPRTGSDTTCARVMDRIPAISTHAPRTGSDHSPRGWRWR